MPLPRSTRQGFFASFLLIAVVGTAAPALLAQQAKPTAFTKQVEAHFDDWDKNHDGTLQASELDALVVDASVKGEAAAAVAALKGAQRSGKFELPPFTLEYLHKYEADAAKPKQKAPPAPAASPNAPSTATPSFDRSYSRGLRRITTSKRDIFADGIPSLEACHQGPLGDCFLVSVIGASVVRNPEDVHQMIKQDQDGSCTVSFPNGKTVHLAALTDTELALTSTTGNDGVWLAVLEKAYGTVRNESLPGEKQTESTTDTIAKGGSTTSTIRLLTGHNVDRVGFRPRSAEQHSRRPPHDNHDEHPLPDEKTDKPTPQIDPAVLQAHLDATLPKVRDQLVAAMEAHRLVAAGTPKDGKMPPGINPNHAYAVLGFDKDTDTVKLWNPHGNNFTPKGEPGLEHGYATKAGHFSMPLSDMGHVFNGIAFETGDAAKR